MCMSNFKDLKTLGFYTAIVAEFLGTFLLVIFACGATEYKGVTNLHISLAFALSVGSIVWAIAHKSGGHINPAVTFPFLLCRRISLARAILYMAAQVAGGIAGALVLDLLTPGPSPDIKLMPSLGAVGLGDNVTVVQGFFVEFFITLVFVFVIFSAVDPFRKDLGGSVPLTIGLTIGMCHLWAIPFTGSGMNPARSLGPALIAKKWANHWIYWAGPLLGGAVGGILYDFVFAANASVAKLKGFFTVDYDNDDYDKVGRRTGGSDNTEMKP